MTDILVRPQELRQTAQQLRASANRIASAMNAVDSSVQVMNRQFFSGNRAVLVQANYYKQRDGLLTAKNLVVRFANGLQNAADVFEAADRGQLQGGQVGRPITGTSNNFEFPKWAQQAMERIKLGGEALQSLALIAALRNGGTYLGQVKILGSHWYSKYILGLPENLRHINAANFVDDLSRSSIKATPWSTAFTFVKLAADVIPDWFKYKDDPSRFGASFAANSFIAAASLQASVYGVKAGALIGTAICPGVGTVVGGLVGGFLAGWATDHVLKTPFSELIPQMSTVAGTAVGNQILPGSFGLIGGGIVGNNLGHGITGLISPDITKLSVKDMFVEGMGGFIDSAGKFIGNQIYPDPVRVN